MFCRASLVTDSKPIANAPVSKKNNPIELRSAVPPFPAFTPPTGVVVTPAMLPAGKLVGSVVAAAEFKVALVVEDPPLLLQVAMMFADPAVSEDGRVKFEE
ncbi:MAG: hypothetical protein JWO40_307 [Candidatus Doudnabacteria bacterium]|nr:hypothetical protein [Candidatus Doudnabacteria bacterium]